jgi:hypothetical protein
MFSYDLFSYDPKTDSLVVHTGWKVESKDLATSLPHSA